MSMSDDAKDKPTAFEPNRVRVVGGNRHEMKKHMYWYALSLDEYRLFDYIDIVSMN